MKYINNAVVWMKKDKNGKTFLSFKTERDIKDGESINLFKNDKGDNPARPDYRSYDKVEEDEDKKVVEEDDEEDQIPF